LLSISKTDNLFCISNAAKLPFHIYTSMNTNFLFRFF
jgi:hypothetical protein